MTDVIESASADDRLLDLVLDRALAAWGAGRRYGGEDVLRERPDLRERVEETLHLALSISVDRPPGLPAVGAYELLRELGRGASGVVYLARHRGLRRLAALKILSGGAWASVSAQQRLVAEARALARVRHANIVGLYEVLEVAGAPVLALEYVEGRSLAQCLAQLRQARPPSLAILWQSLGAAGEPAAGLTLTAYFCRMACGLARALGEVHRNGILHRDVKPGNILLRRDGSPVLTDFGLARDDEREPRTRTGQFLGTPHYAAPEQLRGEWSKVDARTDVYALGVTLYECLTLRLPYRASSSAEVVARIERGLSIPLRRANPSLPRDLDTIVSKAIEPDPARRYASAQELAEDLERLLSLQPIRARRASVVVRVSRALRRNRRVLLGAALGGALVLAATGAWAWQRSLRSAREARAAEHQRKAQLALILREHELRERYDAARSAPAGAASVDSSLARPPDRSIERAVGAPVDRPVDRIGEAVREYALAAEDADPGSPLAIEAEAVALAWASRERSGARPSPSFRASCPLATKLLAAWPKPSSAPTLATADLQAAGAIDRRAIGLIAWVVDDPALVLRAWSSFDTSVRRDALVDAAFGEFFLSLNYSAMAYPRLAHAVESYPEAGFLWLDNARAALQVDDIQTAGLALKRAEALGESLPPRMDAWFHRKGIESVQQLVGTPEGYEIWIQGLQQRSAFHHRIGLALESRGELAAAVEEYRAAVAQSPNDPEFPISLARAVDAWWQRLAWRERMAALARVLGDPAASRNGLGLRLESLAKEWAQRGAAGPSDEFSARNPTGAPGAASVPGHGIALGDLDLTLEVVKMDRSKLWAVPQAFKQALATVCLVSDVQPVRGLLRASPVARTALRGALGLSLVVAASTSAQAQAPTNDYSLSFDGVSGHVKMPYNAGMDVGTTMTLECWARLSEASHSDTLVKQFQAGVQNKYLASLGDGVYIAYAFCPGVSTWPTFTPAPSRWYHFASVKDDSGMRIYVNGTLLASNGCGSSIANGSADFALGSDFAGSYMKGLLSAVRVSRVARYTSDFVPQLTWTADADDILNLPLEDGVGTTTSDIGPLADNGVFNGGVSWVSGGPTTEMYQVSPPSGSFLGGNTLTLTGLLLNDPAGVVLFNGVLGTVVTTGFDTMTVKPPAGTPGQTVDIAVANSNGFATLTGAYTYTPKLATSVSGTASTGGTVTAALTSHLSVTGIYGIALGPALGSPIPIAPFNYGLLVFPFTIMKQGSLPVSGASPVFPFGISPSLAGVPITLQGIALTLVPLGGAFTNASTFTIAP